MTKKILGFCIFLGVFSLIYGGMNYYVYKHIVTGLSISGGALFGVRIVFWLLGSAYIVNQIIKRKVYIRLLAYLGAAWMGILSFALSIFIVFDILRLLIVSIDYHTGFNISLLTITLLTLTSIFNAARGPVVKKINIKHKKFNESDLRIVQLSDVHLGMLTSDKWISDIVSKVNSLEPDIIVITGDFIDDTFIAVERYIPIVSGLKAKNGIYAVSGNHEHYQGENSFDKFCKETNIKVLNNEAHTLGNINLIGLDDASVSRRKDFHKVIGSILDGLNKEFYNILLIHQPLGFEKSSDLGVDLQLSGHTHGGQIPPLSIIVYFFYKYSYGLYAYKNSHIYTSSGTGTWGPPMRLFTKSEIVLLDIH